MSGGKFDYRQHQILMIIDDLQDIIDKNKVEKTEEELRQGHWYDDNDYIKEYYEKYPPFTKEEAEKYSIKHFKDED